VFVAVLVRELRHEIGVRLERCPHELALLHVPERQRPVADFLVPAVLAPYE
jgi:hypothetical protein